MSYTVYYGVIAGIMLVSLFIFILTVREKKWAHEMEEDSVKYGIEGADGDNTVGAKKLSRGEMMSLIFILVSVALWYFGYNAVTSKYAVYATNILHKDYNTTMLLAQGAAIIAYIPAGIIASKIGRKKTIIGGVVMLASAFGLASFMDASSPAIVMNILFALAGIGWATINVNSFPMVVEMCTGSNTGKYTGYYYTASMAAQIATPIVSGFLMDKIADTVLFPYAAAFAALALVTMLFVKHGDSKAPVKDSVLENLDVDG
jgi:MFS family permease